MDFIITARLPLEGETELRSCKISIEDKKVEEYSRLFFPLTQNTIDMLTNMLPKEVKKDIYDVLCDSSQIAIPTTKEEWLSEIYTKEIDRSIQIAKSSS